LHSALFTSSLHVHVRSSFLQAAEPIYPPSPTTSRVLLTEAPFKEIELPPLFSSQATCSSALFHTFFSPRQSSRSEAFLTIQFVRNFLFGRTWSSSPCFFETVHFDLEHQMWRRHGVHFFFFLRRSKHPVIVLGPQKLFRDLAVMAVFFFPP